LGGRERRREGERCTAGGEKWGKLYEQFQKLDHNSVVIVLARNRLYPLGHIVHSNQNVQKPKGVWKRSYEIDAPYIKNLNYQYGIDGHHIPF
jgi:hypothetical protein